MWLRRPLGSSAAVVFLHGLLSDGDRCWRHANGTYWPELVATDFPESHLGVYVFSYKTEAFSGTYRPSDIVDALKEQMRLDGVTCCRSLIFVAHSMGGIVARKYIVEHSVDLVRTSTTVALFLVGSPSLGSPYANWIRPLARIFRHSQVEILPFSQSNQWLMDLDKEFLNLKEGHALRLFGKELLEDDFVIFRRFPRWAPIVPAASAARYFGEPLKIPASNHFSIAKPANAEAVQHRVLVQFIRTVISADVPVVAGEPPASPEAPPSREPAILAEAPERWQNPIDGTVFIRMPAARFTMGQSPTRLAAHGYTANPNAPPEWEPHTVLLTSYWIARVPITNAQWRRFCIARARPLPPRVDDPAFSGDDHPVIGISWWEAMDYLRWADAALPTEAQWERAAAGTSGRVFPWGDSAPTDEHCNHLRMNPGTTAVTAHIKGATPEGLLDMAGNVLEWCRDDSRPYTPDFVSNPQGDVDGQYAALRGGSFARSPNQCRASYRDRRRKTDNWGSTGLRPVRTGAE